MPELPEIETIKRGLERKVIGKTIVEVIVRDQKLMQSDPIHIINKKILAINRYGKLLDLELSENYALLIHLKMTGQLVFQSSDETEKIIGGHPQKSYNKPLPHKHTHIIIIFSDDSRLFFNDLRKFGYMKILNSSKIQNDNFIKLLGVDALNPRFDSNYLLKKISSRPKTTIYQALLDQRIVGGIGNIYANESLYDAKILPQTKNFNLDHKKIKKIITSIVKILNRAIERGGSSDNTYRQIDGKIGTYLDIVLVYHKQFDPYNHRIKKQKIGGRTAHFCPICQK